VVIWLGRHGKVARYKGKGPKSLVTALLLKDPRCSSKKCGRIWNQLWTLIPQMADSVSILVQVKFDIHNPMLPRSQPAHRTVEIKVGIHGYRRMR
jgi:hypothetical protein